MQTDVFLENGNIDERKYFISCLLACNKQVNRILIIYFKEFNSIYLTYLLWIIKSANKRVSKPAW
jgi:hypothetical protein